MNTNGFHAPLFSALTRVRLPEWAPSVSDIFVLCTQRNVVELLPKSMRIFYAIAESSIKVETF